MRISEKILCKQLTVFPNDNISKYRCGFRKGCNAQHSLVALLVKCKGEGNNKEVFFFFLCGHSGPSSGENAADLNNNKEEFEALLTYLSKAFDCLSHELIIVKLSVYGFSLPVLRLIHDYIYQVKNKELKLIKLIVHGSRLHSEYLKDQKLDLY